MPRFVERAFRGYLDCGLLAKGFVRVFCPECKQESLVAFSCKDRGFCPSCTARRAAQTAAHLVDEVVPHVPVRQWVLSLHPPPWAAKLTSQQRDEYLTNSVIALNATIRSQRESEAQEEATTAPVDRVESEAA